MKKFDLKLKFADLQLECQPCQYFKDESSIEKVDNGFIIRRTIKNVTNNILRLYGVKYKINGIYFNKNLENDYFYANENARLFCNLTIPVDYNRLCDNATENQKFGLHVDRKFCDPEVERGDILSSPYQPFPAILVSNYITNIGLICGSLSQKYFCHTFDVKHENGYVSLFVNACFKGVAYREIYPNEQLVDEFFVGETERADNINGIFDCYTKELRKVLTDNQGGKSINRHSLIWDSWNDGIYRDVSEKMLIEEAKAVKDLFPTVEWFQLDDGYSAYCEENVDLDAHGLGVPYEGDDGIDREKFPDGLKAYTDKIKSLGLKPAIWVGGFCPVKTLIYKERPDWFIDYTYRIDRTQPLDVSKAEVRDYMQNAISKFFIEYGFEGLKHDFWSYAFEDRHDILSNKEKSGYEYREWWQKHIREIVTENGYVETGCDLSMGNPFIGKYFNNYRFGLDVGAGKWDNVKTTMFWAVATLSTQTGDLFVPNSDSIGLLPGLSDVEFLYVVNFQIITRTLCEISGRFSKVDKDNPRLKILQRAVSYLNNGEKVYFANYDYRKHGFNLPEVIYINSPCFKNKQEQVNVIKSVALFNDSEKVKEISVSLSDLGLERGSYKFTEVWDDVATEVRDDLRVSLNARQSKLYFVEKQS